MEPTPGTTPSQTPRTPQPPRKKPINPLFVVLGLSAAFFAVFLMISAAVFLAKPSSKSAGPAGIFGPGSVAVLEVNGVIMDSKKTLKQLQRFEENDGIKAIVLRINSPGGAVAPSQEIYEALKKSKKPVVASMGSVAASGGYYIAVAAKKIYANPGTITGSIGVIMEFANLEKLYEWAKIKRYALKTGRFKDAGSEYREMQPEERALLQGMIEDVLGQFKRAVAEGRKLKLEQVTPLADGRIFSGAQAKAVKLVDETGTLQDAIDDAAKMAGIQGKPNVVYPDRGRRPRLLDILMDERRDDSGDAESRAGGLLGWLDRLGFGGEGGLARTLEETVTGLTPGIYWLWTGAR